MIRTEFFKVQNGMCKVEIDLFDRRYKVWLPNMRTQDMYLAIDSLHHTDQEVLNFLGKNGFRTLQNVLDLNFNKELSH